MELRSIHIQMSVRDIQTIIAIVLDEEPRQALTFVKEAFFKQVTAALAAG